MEGCPMAITTTVLSSGEALISKFGREHDVPQRELGIFRKVLT